MAILTKSQENYLEIIYKLSVYADGVHIASSGRWSLIVE